MSNRVWVVFMDHQTPTPTSELTLNRYLVAVKKIHPGRIWISPILKLLRRAVLAVASGKAAGEEQDAGRTQY